MLNNFLPYLILSCMFNKAVVSQVYISADKETITNGDGVTLTCNITTFSFPASWVNSNTSGPLTTCFNTGSCSPASDGRYSYSANSSTIVATISQFNGSIDNFGWQCQHSTYSVIYIFNVTTPTPTTATTATTTTKCTIWISVLVVVLLFVLAVILIVIVILIVMVIINIKYKGWVIWILKTVAVLFLLAGVILIVMVNIYLKYKDCFIWIIVAILLLVLGLIVVVIVIYIKYKKWQRRPICVSCKKNKCEYCKESFGILICKCEKSFGRLICNFCKKNNCKDCKESAGIVICKCCLMKKCKDCAESARTLLCKSHNMKNCDACTESSGILICRFCEKENCKGCTKSTEMLICKCCDSERNENPEKKLICNCCKQMKCKSCSVSPEKESFRMLICKCCNLKYKRNHEDGRRSASENGQQENVNKRNPDSSMSNVSRKDIEIQMEGNVVNRDLERAFGSPNKVGIELRDGPKYESVSFDLHEIRPLPLQPKNDRTQRGLSANFEDNQGLPSDRSNKLPPLNHQLQSTIQEEDTIKRPRKTKKKKGKNKTGDESKNVDELAESK